jgi:hypothetical protein
MIVYPNCSELLIQYVADNIKPLCMTTAEFRDLFDVWEEQLECYRRQENDYGKDVNLVSVFARWTDDMYGDGLSGLKALYDAEQYERPRYDSQLMFPFTYGKLQYDMTFAVRVVRTMFLQVRPDLQASIAGLEDRDLLPKMEALLGGYAASRQTLEFGPAAVSRDGGSLDVEQESTKVQKKRAGKEMTDWRTLRLYLNTYDVGSRDVDQ